MCAMLKCWIYIYILSAWFVKFEHLHMQMSEWELWGLVGLRNRIMMDLSITGSRQPFWKAVFGEMACFFFCRALNQQIYLFCIFWGHSVIFIRTFSLLLTPKQKRTESTDCWVSSLLLPFVCVDYVRCAVGNEPTHELSLFLRC